MAVSPKRQTLVGQYTFPLSTIGFLYKNTKTSFTSEIKSRVIDVLSISNLWLCQKILFLTKEFRMFEKK